jgi:hypothetical protein
MAVSVVLESEDLTSLIVEYLDPTSIVALGRVSRDVRTAMRSAIRGAPNLLVRVARNAGALTKSQLVGWFALTSLEADALPRSQYVRLQGPGFYFLYRTAAFDRALDDYLVSAEGWEARLRARGSAAATSQGDLVKMGRKREYEWHTPPRYRCLARCR